MKKIILGCLILSVVIFASCHFEIPEKVSVKTNAEYNFSMGTIDKSLDDIVNISDLLNDDALSSINGKVYDYRPDNQNIQRFLMKIPFMEIPVDIGSYYDDSALSAAIQDFSFEKTIEIPEIAFKQSVDLPASAMGSIETIINSLSTLYINDASNVTEAPIGFVSQPSVGSIDSIYYNSCEFVITFTGTILDGSEVKLIANGKTVSGYVSGNAVHITASDIKLSNGVVIKFASPYSGNITCNITNGSIKYVTGFSASSAIELDSVNADVDIPALFDSCKIATGSLSLATKMPDNWKGVTVTNKVSTSGVVTITETTENSISLDNQTLNPGNLRFTVTPSVEFNNATIYFNSTPSFTAGINVIKFADITINADDIATQLNQKDEFPVSVRSTVNSIMLAPSGLKGKYINTFPAGNDIKINVESDFFGLSGKSAELSGGTATKTAFDSILCDDDREVFFDTNDDDSSKYKEWDINLSIIFPGNIPGKIKLQDVKPKDSYKIGIDITPVFDWKEITINANAFSSTPIEDIMSLGINISDLLNSIPSETGITEVGKSLNFVNLPIYIRAEKPGLAVFDDFEFTGSISLFQGTSKTDKVSDTNGVIEEVLLSSGDSIGFVEPFEKLDIKDKTLSTNISSKPASIRTDIAPFFNRAMAATSGELYIDYNVKLATSERAISINKSDLTNNTGAKVSVYALIDLPLRIKTTQDITVDLKTVMSLDDSDLFQRDSASSMDEIKNYIDVIKSASIVYKNDKLPIISTKDIEVQLQLFNDSPAKVIGAGGGTLTIASDEVDRMLNIHPYKLEKFTVVLPKDAEITIPRKMDYKANISLQLVTDGEIEIFGGKN